MVMYCEYWLAMEDTQKQIIRHHNIPSTAPSSEQATIASCLNLPTFSINKRFIFSEKNIN